MKNEICDWRKIGDQWVNPVVIQNDIHPWNVVAVISVDQGDN